MVQVQEAAPPKELAYSMEGLAKALRTSRAHLYKEVQAGRLRTFKIGGRRLVSLDAARQYVAAAEAAEAGRVQEAA